MLLYFEHLFKLSFLITLLSCLHTGKSMQTWQPCWSCFVSSREQVQERTWTNLDSLCLDLRGNFCLFSPSSLGRIWSGALWHSLLHWLAFHQRKHHGNVLHRSPLCFLFYSPLWSNCHFLLSYSGNCERIQESSGTACLRLRKDEQCANHYCQGIWKLVLNKPVLAQLGSTV